MLKELSIKRRIGEGLPALLVLLYWATLAALGGLRGDHYLAGAVTLLLFYGGSRLLALRGFLLPLILTGIIYDSQRFYSHYLRGAVRVAEPYLFDRRFFGIPTEAGVLTPNEWWQLHTHPVLDFFTGLAYLVFIAVFVLSAAHFRFITARKGTPTRVAEWIGPRAPATMWSFFWVNMIGYSTYHWYAAAPPWYVSSHGLGPAKLDVAANPAGCLRFDQLLGTDIFSSIYGRSADVFGAIPSLHVAYPLITVYFAFKFGTFRVAAVLFYALMCFSAVYLNHHYVLDVLWGSAYAVVVALGVDRYYERKLMTRPQPVELPLSA
ncbi:MAG: phosphatase PAP2 family protein [Oligoflexia bacterium]|nr:phosphatase PAP2 family protein [Oligoflexia bacterium]